MPPVGRPVANTADYSVLLDQPLDVGSEDQAEIRVLGGLAGEKFEKSFLGNQHDVGERSLQSAEVDRRERTLGKQERRAVPLDVWQAVQPLGQANLVQQFQDHRMQGVAPKLAVEVLVGFQECHGDAFPLQQQRQNHPAGTAADNATRRPFQRADFSVRFPPFGQRGVIHHVHPSDSREPRVLLMGSTAFV
jgi:hypothetical protein